MDSNLHHWKNQEQSFLRRLRIWLDLLDPLSLIAGDAEIQKAHTLLGSGENVNEKDVTLSLSSVHADSGANLPLIYRPPALLPMSLPLVAGSLIPHIRIRHAAFWQFMLQSYFAGFNSANRNSSSEKNEKKTHSTKHLLIAGTVVAATCAGVLPQFLLSQTGIITATVHPFVRSVLPIPLSAALAYINVSFVRSDETETGIQVFDSSGNPVGLSEAAGEKAVRETALSRAALFGTTGAVPFVLSSLLKRTRFALRNSPLVGPLSGALVLFLTIPVSFSLFPQLGTIRREDVEDELQAAAYDGQLYYHRGL
ncbi:sideroflexin-4 [Dicentrarchus labrax]|uniref:Sideroflexin 4 n=1 Tax=Dicentrarchus labrax TaxID=13489 RepID=A0A8P4KKU7_DICLA|nr:sideroflexin-4 [Dicentrarchus labrax]